MIAFYVYVLAISERKVYGIQQEIYRYTKVLQQVLFLFLFILWISPPRHILHVFLYKQPNSKIWREESNYQMWNELKQCGSYAAPVAPFFLGFLGVNQTLTLTLTPNLTLTLTLTQTLTPNPVANPKPNPNPVARHYPNPVAWGATGAAHDPCPVLNPKQNLYSRVALRKLHIRKRNFAIPKGRPCNTEFSTLDLVLTTGSKLAKNY